jgi:hypothetical protein
MTQMQGQEQAKLAQEQQMQAMQQKLIESQIGRNNTLAAKGTTADNPYGAIDPSKFTQESIRKFGQSGDYGDLVLRESSRLSTADIANAEWLLDPSRTDAERDTFFKGKRDPRYQNIPGAGFGAPDQGTGEFNVSVPEAAIVSGTQERSRVGAEGATTGAAQGDQAAKAPVKVSFDIAANNMRDAIKKTPQGGTFGAIGKYGTLFDYQDAMAFDNASQQMSTELRTVFRIPGEGTLSDREQEQYNLQLPNRKYSAERNEKIISDLEARMNARVTTPIGGESTAQPMPDLSTLSDEELQRLANGG